MIVVNNFFKNFVKASYRSALDLESSSQLMFIRTIIVSTPYKVSNLASIDTRLDSVESLNWNSIFDAQSPIKMSQLAFNWKAVTDHSYKWSNLNSLHSRINPSTAVRVEIGDVAHIVCGAES